MNEQLDSVAREKGVSLPDNILARYPNTYRITEVRTVAKWVSNNRSGSIVGLPGSGKSNFLNFLCHRPAVVQSHLPPSAPPISFVPVDFNNLVSGTLATFYRVILRSFYTIRNLFPEALQQSVIALYQDNKAALDPFLSQSALHELLLEFRSQRQRVVLIIDHFDDFCQAATPEMTNTLRGLRDSFKNTLSYIVGMQREAIYLSDPAALGELYELLDTYVCYIGAMTAVDSRQLVIRETRLAARPPDEDEVEALLALSGCYASLLKVVCDWWLDKKEKPRREQWEDALWQQPNVQHRLQEIWTGLQQEERFLLAEMQNAEGGYVTAAQEQQQTLKRLAAGGICRKTDEGWRINGRLFARYAAAAMRRTPESIWVDEETEDVYKGEMRLDDLTPLEARVLRFLVQNPRVRHAKTDLIVNTWPSELRRKGVSDDSLYQVISSLRKKIEPAPSRPRYIISRRGWPESTYQFFPEGQPN